MEQKFKKGDHVKIADDLGESMSHFQSGCDAIVIGSYADQYGGSDITSYTLHIKGSGENSWYYENQLELIEPHKLDLLDTWKKEEQKEIDQKSDLDWIFANGEDVIKNPHGSSISALASCLGIANLWGSHGEGIVYYENSLRILKAAAPFLLTGSKKEWLEICEEYKTGKDD